MHRASALLLLLLLVAPGPASAATVSLENAPHPLLDSVRPSLSFEAARDELNDVTIVFSADLVG